MATETSSSKLGDRLLNITQAYGFSLAEIQAKKGISENQRIQEIAEAEKKFVKGLKNLKVSDAAIDAIKTVIEKMPEQQAMILEMMMATSKQQLTHVMDLQAKQAEMAMRMNSKTGEATSSIASIGAMISAVARYFGADDFANTVDAKTKDIMGRVTIALNTDGIGRGNAGTINDTNSKLSQLIIENAQRVTGMTSGTANSASPSLPAAMETYVGSASNAVEPTPSTAQVATPAKSEGISWGEVKEGLDKAGVTKEDSQKILKIFGTTSGKEGDATRIDSLKEAAELITAIKKETGINKAAAPVVQNIIKAREMHITGNT